MKAIVCEKYGTPDVLQLKEIEKPIPKENEVLIKVLAASVNAADWHMLTADIFLVRLAMGITKPKRKVLGEDVSGLVEEVGPGVTRFKPGDAVFGDIFAHGSGSFAEYAVAREEELILKPGRLSFEEAAAIPLAGVTALQAFQKAGTELQGKDVLIQGAAGGVGIYALQLAKHFGANVTAVCSAGNREQALSLGADHVIDYKTEDFTRSGKSYDLILAVNGFHPITDYKRTLKDNGMYIMIGGTAKQMFQTMLLGPLVTLGSRKKMIYLSAKSTRQDLDFLTGLVLEDHVRPVIDRKFPLRELADALRYQGTGHAHGKIIITVD